MPLLGLITAKDLLSTVLIRSRPAIHAGRLRVGRDWRDGDYLERAAEVLRGADVLSSTSARALAHDGRAIEEVRKRCGDVELIAGNVATEEGARFLAERGVNAVKVGIGPGGGCTTRLATNFGVPQVEAIVRCRQALGEEVPLIADGGVRRDGSLAAALLFGGDAVMLGSAFAGTIETPGDEVLKSVFMPESQKLVQVPFKVFRGMASVGAIRDRLDLEEAEPRELRHWAPKDSSSACRPGSVRAVIHDMLKHLCSAVSYGGAGARAWRPGRIPGAIS